MQQLYYVFYSSIINSQPTVPQNSRMMGVPPSMSGNFGMMGQGPNMINPPQPMDISVDNGNRDRNFPPTGPNTRLCHFFII